MKDFLILVAIVIVSCNSEPKRVYYTYYGTANWKSMDSLAKSHGDSLTIDGVVKKQIDNYGLFNESDTSTNFGLMLIAFNSNELDQLIGKPVSVFGWIDTTTNVDSKLYLGAIKVLSINEKIE
ncbi:MAG: hypothetical protein WA960_01015 [Tunicatimonas sp.]